MEAATASPPTLLIRKETMIQKNTRNIKDVYTNAKEENLGSGAFGKVIKVIHNQTKQERACKVIPKRKIKNTTSFEQEIDILCKMDHPNVLKLYEYFEDNKNMYIVTELLAGPELFDKITENDHLSETDTCVMMKQILTSINYCHSKEVAHRDIKPENFIFESNDDDADLKIIDFGLSKLCHSSKFGLMEKCKTKAGTITYIAPEVLTGNYDKQCDLWSAGCILYICLSGMPPFYGDDDSDILKSVMKGSYEFDDEVWESVSKDAKDLIKNLICKPEKRLTAAEALEHRWFKNNKQCSGPKKKLYKRNVKSFKSYMKTHKLQQAAMTAIAIQASPEDIKELKQAFRALDKNGDGSITLKELEDGLGHKENKKKLLKLL